MKKSLKLALAAAVLVGGVSMTIAGNEQTPGEARARLQMIIDLFKAKGLDSFNFMNGHDSAGLTKNRHNVAGLNYSELTKSDDEKGTIICIQNGNYAVNQMDPRKVGRDSMTGADTWRDGVGVMMTEKVIEALRNSPDGWASVKYVETTPGVNNEREGKPIEAKFEFFAVRSDVLLGRANDTGMKFFCGVRYKNFNESDMSDRGNRMVNPDRPQMGSGAKKHHHHAKKAAPKADAAVVDPKEAGHKAA